MCSSLNERDVVSHPYKTTGKIIVFFVLIFAFLDSRREKKYSEEHDSKHNKNNTTITTADEQSITVYHKC
jgi:hypothetical protein